MNNLKSYTEYAVTAPTTDFVIGFDFNYGTDAVNVTVDDVPAVEAGYSVIYLNSTTMRLSPAVPTGVVRLQRETDIDVPDNQFTAGAKFIASNMDENFTQIRHAQQEVRDGFEKLSEDTYEIIDTLQVVGQAAQDAADAAEQAAELANDAAAQVSDKVPKSATLPTYLTVAAGVDPVIGVAEGAYFNVRSTSDESYIEEYQNVGGSAVATGRSYSSTHVIVVNSISDLQALPGSQRMEGLRYLVKGYHAGSDVGGGEFYWSSTDATAHDGVLVFSAHGTPNGRFIRITKGAISPADAGCVVGEADSSDALTRLFHTAIDKGLTVRPDTLGETYEFSGDLEFVFPGKRLYVDGRGLQLNSSDGYFETSGSIALLGPILTNPASTGEYSINVTSTDGIQVGDLLAIHNPTDYSFSSHRPQYRSGEFVRVKSVGANILTFNSALNDNYPSGITNIYKINTADFKATDFHVNAEGRHSSMRLSFLADFELINCSARGGYQRGLMIDRCSVGYILGGRYICDAPAGAGSPEGSGSALQYGINYYCCEDVEVRKAYCFGTRHPIASGGETLVAGIVTRRCNAYECILESSTPNVHGPDFHGNAEDCHYSNCQSNQAVGLAGKNVSWTGGTIGALQGSTLRPLSWHEVVGGVIKYAGVKKVVVPPSVLTFGQINSVANANIDHDFSIIIDDIDLVYSGHTGSTLGPLTCVNSKATLTSWDVSLTRIRHTGRTGPFSALFSTTDAVGNKDFSRLIARDVQGWGDITTSVGLPVSVSVPPDTELDMPSLFVDSVAVLQSGEWSASIIVPIKTQLRIPKIRLYYGVKNTNTEAGVYVWANCFVQTVTRSSVTLRLTTGSPEFEVSSAVSMPVTIEIVP